MKRTDELLARIEQDLSVSEDAMRSIPADAAPDTPDTAPEVGLVIIDTYSRSDAIADGILVAVDEATSREAGIRIPVALTAAAHADCVAWTDEDSRRQTPQDESGRLWDVLFMTAVAARRSPGGSSCAVELYRVPRDGRTQAARPVQLKAVISGGDNGEPVMTISQPHED
jgi:hypothetical protein